MPVAGARLAAHMLLRGKMCACWSPPNQQPRDYFDHVALQAAVKIYVQIQKDEGDREKKRKQQDPLDDSLDRYLDLRRLTARRHCVDVGVIWPLELVLRTKAVRGSSHGVYCCPS